MSGGEKYMIEKEYAGFIGKALEQAGLRKGTAVLVHSSLKSMGNVPGGPETVIQGILDAIGPDGTLLMPALSYKHVNNNSPVFDVLRTPSNVGVIPEYFRTRKGTLRSINPTHSVCGTGARAEEILRDHCLDETPCGPNSPFRKLYEYNGQILFLGCGLAPNTSMHAVEEMVNPPYLFDDYINYRVIDKDGSECEKKCKRHGFNGWIQRYDRVLQILEKGDVIKGKVLCAEIYILEAKALWDKALEILEDNPLYFVDKSIS